MMLLAETMLAIEDGDRVWQKRRAQGWLGTSPGLIWLFFLYVPL